MKLIANLKHKRVGFYLSLVGIILLMVASIVYTIGFSSGESVRFYNAGALVCAIFAVLLFIGLSLFRVTERYAAFPAWFLSLLSFLLFVLGSYMYLSEVFYSGISEETLKNLRIDYIVPVICYLFSVIICNVALFNKQSKDNYIKEEVRQCEDGYFSKAASKKNKIVIFSSAFGAVAIAALVIGISTPNYVPKQSATVVDTGLVIDNPEIAMDLGVAPTANIVAHVSEGYVLSYKSQNPDIAIVDNTGMVTAINRGQATVDVISKMAGRPRALETKSVVINIDAPSDFYQMKTGTQAKNGDVVANPGNWYFYTLTTSGTRIAYVANNAVNLTFNGVDANKEWYLRYQPTLPTNANYVATMTIDINIDILARFGPTVDYRQLHRGLNTISIERTLSSTTPFSMTLLANESPEEATINRKNYSGNFSMKITNITFGQNLVFEQDSFAIDMNGSEKTAQIEVSDPTSSSATFTYESLNPSVATVTNSGLITALSEGETKIRVTSSTGNSGEVSVVCSYHYVTLDKSNGFIDVDKNPDDQLGFESDVPDLVHFTSSDETVATVTDAGLVTGIKKGIVTITASCGAAQASCSYMVVKPSELPTEYQMEIVNSAPTGRDSEVVKDPGIWHSYPDGHSRLVACSYSTEEEKGKIDFTLSMESKTVYLKYQPSLPVGEQFTIRFTFNVPDGYVKGSGDVFQIAGTSRDIAAGANPFEVNSTVNASKPFSIKMKLSIAGNFSITGIEVIER